MRRLAQFAVGMVFALAVASAAPARAAEVLSLQAQAMNGGWSLPAPGQRAALCLVDSGLDPSQLDVPPGIKTDVIAGIASSAPATGPDGKPMMHGTWMVQATVAPADGVGMIGPTPGIPIILVRAMRDGTGVFAGADYAAGMLQCDAPARRAGWRVAAIGLALGSDDVAQPELLGVAQGVQHLAAVVVAAGGNRPGVPLFPARVDGVLGITSVSAVSGERCAGAADSDPEAAGLVGPGCFETMPIEGAAQPVVSAGTSAASVMVAAAVAQTCDLAPALTPKECLGVVQRTARTVPGGSLPDLHAAAIALGVNPPAVTTPAATLPTTSGPDTTTGPQAVAIAPVWYGSGRRPKLARATAGRVVVTSPDKARVATLWTNLRGARSGRYRTVTGRPRGSSVKVRVSQTIDGTAYERQWTLHVPRKR